MRTAPIFVVAVLALALTGCGTGTPAADPTSPLPTVDPTPTADPQPQSLVLGVDGISIVDDAGTTVDSVEFTDGAGTLAFLGTWIGTPPPVDSTPYGDNYDWDNGVGLNVRGDYATVNVTASEASGLELRTEDGIHVGSTRADVVALSPFDDGYDSDGDGKTDILGLDPVEVPGTESLSNPGHVGTAYVGVFFIGDDVSRLQAQGSDFGDV